jgi:hypothetical protein
VAVRTYEFRSLGTKETARSLLELAAAHIQLAKAEDFAVKATARRVAGGGSGAGVQRDAHVRARQAEQKRIERINEKSARDAVRATEKAERDKTRAVERELKKREQLEKRSSDARMREAKKAHKKEEREASRRLDMRRKTSLTGMIGDRMTGIAARGVGMLGIGGAVMSLGSMAYDATAAATRQRLINEQKARALAVSGGDRDSWRSLLNSASGTAQGVRGTRAEDVLTGQQKFVAMTGDLAGARKFGGTMATAARATGAHESDIAATMATLSTKFGIKDEGAMQAAMASLVAGGKSGAFEMGDAARYFSELGAAGTRFGLDSGAGGVQKLGAMAQIARMSTGSGAEASTGVQAMLRQLTAKSADIKRLNGGKEVVFADKGKTKTNDVVDVLAGTLKAAKGNKVELQKIFGDEGMKGASEFIKRFNEAGQALGPTATEAEKLAAGEKAVRAAFDELSGKAGSWSDVVADATTMTSDLGSKMTTVWEKVVADVGGAVTPGLSALAEHADLVVGALTKFAQEVGLAAGNLSNMITFLERFGFIKKEPVPGGDPSKEKLDRLTTVDARLAALGSKKELTSGEKAEKRRLQMEQNDLRIETGTSAAYANMVQATQAKGGRNIAKSIYESEFDLYGGIKSGDGPMGDDYKAFGTGRFDELPEAPGIGSRFLDAGKKSLMALTPQAGAVSTAYDIFSGLGTATGASNQSSEQAAKALADTAAKQSAAADKLAAAADKIGISIAQNNGVGTRVNPQTLGPP